MSELTPNLGLFKYDPLTDGKEVFSINAALNNNWDILDERCGRQRNIGEILASTIPLTDAGLHLLDGSLIQGGGIYDEFVNYMATLYEQQSNDPSLAEITYAAWNSSTYPMTNNISQLFDGDTTTILAFPDANTGTYKYVGHFKFPINTKVTSMQLYNGTTVDGSTESRVTQIKITVTGYTASGIRKTYTKELNSTNTASKGNWTMDLSDNDVYGTQYEIYIKGTNTYTCMAELAINAAEVRIVTGNFGNFYTEANWQQSVTDYGVCGKFVYDSVNNTVRLPKITGIVEGTTDLTALGDLVEAGLPDHRHSLIERRVYANGTASFAVHGADGTDASYTGYASDSNSIYGNSSTVQPQTIKVLYYIVIATTAKTDIGVDIDEIATDLNGKMDVDGTNAVASVKNFDGAWVSSSLNAFTNVTIGTTPRNIDLSSYLPHDDYDYFVCATILGKPSEAGIICIISGDSGTQLRVRGTVKSVNTEFSGYFVVGRDRSVQCGTITGTWTGAELRFFAYRRIGTNQ